MGALPESLVGGTTGVPKGAALVLLKQLQF